MNSINMEFKSKDRCYLTYEWHCNQKVRMPDIRIDPVKEKLFTGDIIENNKINKISKYRTSSIPGILVISGSTFGRAKNKLYYKCIPNNPALPIFIVPYNNKSKTLSKVKIDLFVEFIFDKWVGKHPVGKLINTFGKVDNIDSYSQYQMLCYNVSHPIQKFNKLVFKKVKTITSEKDIIEDIVEKYPELENRLDKHIISIDPEGCIDIDDAMSIQKTETSTTISIYIANIPMWIDYLNIWKDLGERVTTIYFPNKKIPMLPLLLSDNLCSLLENKKRIAINMDVNIVKNIISSVSFGACLINVNKNYSYDDETLVSDETYINIFKKCKSVNKKYKYVDKIKDSHDIVEMLMLMMNHLVGRELKEKNGVFRTFNIKENHKKQKNIPSDIQRFIKTWGSNGSEYTINKNNTNHDMLSDTIDVYCHSTSPIRRMIDIINTSILMQNKDYIKNKELCQEFIDTWISKIDYINSQVKAIRKIQNQVGLLDYSSKCEFKEKILDGWIVDIQEDDGINGDYKYSVFLPDPGFVSTFISREIYKKYKKYLFSLHTFNDEHTLKRKIKISIK